MTVGTAARPKFIGVDPPAAHSTARDISAFQAAGPGAPKGLGPQTGAYSASTVRVLLLVVTALLVLTQLYAAIPLAGPVGEHLGGSATFALSTVYGFCYAVGFLFWGPMADCYGNKRIMMAGLAGLTALTLACAFATSLPELAVLRALQGFVAASFPPTALAYLAEATRPKCGHSQCRRLERSGDHAPSTSLRPTF